jgi:predicted phage terminase large subunit-like protein
VLSELNAQQIEALISALPSLPLAEKMALLDEIEALESKKALQLCRDDFLAFCHRVYPTFKEGSHHRHLKKMLHDMVMDDPHQWYGSEMPPHAKRLTVSMPPRFGKSETIAYLYVAWYLGHNPSHHIMMVTHTAELSDSFGRKVRDLIDTPLYQEIFPHTQVSKDKSAAGNWTTTEGGKYLAIGIGANVAGHGAHLLVADDLVSEQAVLANPDTAFETAWRYMQVGPLQRLMPGGRIVMIGTRWGRKDPIGRALQWARENPGSAQWYEVRFPAILDVERGGETKTISLWPEQWPLDQLLAKKAGMQPQFWAAQYMQDPTSEEGALIRREWWQRWQGEDPPDCEFVIQVWDTAHETKNHSDYSACQTWGVWFNEETSRHELMLLNALKGRWAFPQLKEKALEQYKEWDPDCLLIEKKAAGAPLIQELRQMDMYIEELNPSRGARGVSNDKRARVNAVAPVFYDKAVWAPQHRWADEVIHECAEFPNGEHDDYMDCAEMAVSRFRRGGFISLKNDRRDDNEDFQMARRAAYY